MTVETRRLRDTLGQGRVTTVTDWLFLASLHGGARRALGLMALVGLNLGAAIAAVLQVPAHVQAGAPGLVALCTVLAVVQLACAAAGLVVIDVEARRGTVLACLCVGDPVVVSDELLNAPVALGRLTRPNVATLAAARGYTSTFIGGGVCVDRLTVRLLGVLGVTLRVEHDEQAYLLARPGTAPRPRGGDE